MNHHKFYIHINAETHCRAKKNPTTIAAVGFLFMVRVTGLEHVTRALKALRRKDYKYSSHVS